MIYDLSSRRPLKPGRSGPLLLRTHLDRHRALVAVREVAHEVADTKALDHDLVLLVAAQLRDLPLREHARPSSQEASSLGQEVDEAAGQHRVIAHVQQVRRVPSASHFRPKSP